jgi:hypothetical protein
MGDREVSSNPTGVKQDPKSPQRRAGPSVTSGTEVRREVQRELNRDNKRETTLRPEQKVSGRQDPYKG